MSLPDTMPAAVYQGEHRLAVEPRPVPHPRPGEVLVEVSHCGVCGTDLHMVIDGWAPPGWSGGHEWSGTVAAVGAGVRDWAVGDVAVGGPDPTCGECPGCAAGRPSLCERRAEPGVGGTSGAFAGYKLVTQDRLVPVPDGLALREAALAEPVAVALHAITRGGLTSGDRVFVSGAGPIGALIVAALTAGDGGHDITVSEPGERRQRLADALGATRVVAPDDLDVPTIAEPGRIVEGASDVAFECSGRAEAMGSALTQVRRGGRLVLVGSGIETPHFDPNRILLNEVEITGSFEYDAGGFPAALAMLASGRLDTSLLIEPDDIPLAGLGDAMFALARGERAGKVMITPNHPGGPSSS